MPPDSPRESPLLKLPSDVLRVIWRNLQQGQPALRQCSRALQHASAAWIEALDLTILLGTANEETEEAGERMDEAQQALDDQTLSLTAYQQSQEQLARFPSDAVLKALSWRCSCCTGDRALLLPSVLPSLFLEAAPKLASLRSLTLSGDMAIGPSELAAVALTCPLLESLQLLDAPLVGPLFNAVSELQELRTLSLTDCLLPHGMVGVNQSLTALTALTCLSLSDKQSMEAYPLSEDDDDLDPVLTLDSVMDEVAFLAGLRELALTLVPLDLGDFGCLAYLSALTALSRLRLGMPLICRCGRGDALEAQLTALSALQQLVHLELPECTLHAPLLSSLTQLPLLHSIRALAVDTDADLSGVPCAWTTVSTTCPFSLRALTHLPLAGVTKLTCGMPLTWELGYEGVADVVRAVGRAARVAAGVTSATEGEGLQLDLRWDEPEAPSAVSTGVLRALAPLAQRRDLCVTLTGWRLDAEHADALAQALPHLRRLGLSASEAASLESSPDFESFLSVVGRSLPRLLVLKVSVGRAGSRPGCSELSQAVSDALMRLAKQRVASGKGLKVVCRGCLTAKQCRAFNRALHALASDTDRGKVHFKLAFCAD